MNPVERAAVQAAAWHRALAELDPPTPDDVAGMLDDLEDRDEGRCEAMASYSGAGPGLVVAAGWDGGRRLGDGRGARGPAVAPGSAGRDDGAADGVQSRTARAIAAIVAWVSTGRWPLGYCTAVLMLAALLAWSGR